jgi:hypothetical protein
MKRLFSLMTLGLALSCGGAYAATHAGAAPMADTKAKAPTGQQSRMATCNKEAEGKKGDERKAFMKTCLSDKGSAAADCEAKAGEKKLAGAAKTSFVKKCTADSATGTAAASCETQAADKKLAGAAKASFVKKCTADAAKS